MKRTLKHTLALCFLSLCFTPQAEAITHHFNTMHTPPVTIEEVETAHWRSTADGIEYTFSTYAEFYTGTGTSAVCLNLFKSTYNSGNYVTISPALSHLSEIVINHTSNLSGNILSRAKVGVYLSTNNSDWTEIASDNISYTAGAITVTVPVGGPYYVKISSKSSTKISITQITYSFSDCNCFTYTPE